MSAKAEKISRITLLLDFYGFLQMSICQAKLIYQRDKDIAEVSSATQISDDGESGDGDIVSLISILLQ